MSTTNAINRASTVLDNTKTIVSIGQQRPGNGLMRFLGKAGSSALAIAVAGAVYYQTGMSNDLHKLMEPSLEQNAMTVATYTEERLNFDSEEDSLEDGSLASPKGLTMR